MRTGRPLQVLPSLVDMEAAAAKRVISSRLGWLAGLIEGEGTFGLRRHTTVGGADRFYVCVAVAMTDEDVVRLACSVAGIGKVYGGQERRWRPHEKPVWTWTAGSQSEVIGLLQLLRPFMGRRRTERIDECMAAVGVEGGA